MRAGVNEMEATKQQEISVKLKAGSLKRYTKIAKTLPRLIKKKQRPKSVKSEMKVNN